MLKRPARCVPKIVKGGNLEERMGRSPRRDRERSLEVMTDAADRRHTVMGELSRADADAGTGCRRGQIVSTDPAAPRALILNS